MLNYEFPPLGGGAGNATYYLLKEFVKYEDLEIDLVTASTSGLTRDQFSKNITIHYLDIGKRRNLHFQSNVDLLRYSWHAYWYCLKLKKKQKIDLIHAFFGIPCGYIALKLGLPYIVSLRGSDVPFYNKRFYWLDKLIFKRLSKKIWRRALAVVANSKDLRNLAQESAPKQDIAVIYNGVDLKMFHHTSNSQAKRPFTVISTSRLIPRKGIRYLVEAFLSFSKTHSKSKLLLIGEGNEQDDLENLVRKGNVSTIEFKGVIPHNDLPKYYQEADVFVLPSLNEGMSNSLLEAMASGLAVITTLTGGAEDLVKGDNGFVLSKPSSKTIANALMRLYDNPGLLLSMKNASRIRIQDFSWSSVAKKYIDIYKTNTF